MTIRPYTAADREACLAALRSNVPEHFVASDEAAYARFLDALPGPYFVVEDGGGRVVAGGGIAAERDDPQTAALCWGIVEATRQRRGIGTALLEHRLAAFLPDHPAVRRVRVNTTQKVQRFYERHGFTVTAVIAGGYGPGLDHVTLERLVGA